MYRLDDCEVLISFAESGDKVAWNTFDIALFVTDRADDDFLKLCKSLLPNAATSQLPLVYAANSIDRETNLNLIRFGFSEWFNLNASAREITSRFDSAVSRTALKVENSQILKKDSKLLNPYLNIKSLISQLKIKNLTFKENAILKELSENWNTVVSKETLFQKVISSRELNLKSLDIHVHSLRKKLASQNVTILSVRGIGWKIVSCDLDNMPASNSFASSLHEN